MSFLVDQRQAQRQVQRLHCRGWDAGAEGRMHTLLSHPANPPHPSLAPQDVGGGAQVAKQRVHKALAAVVTLPVRFFPNRCWIGPAVRAGNGHKWAVELLPMPTIYLDLMA